MSNSLAVLAKNDHPNAKGLSALLELALKEDDNG
jgi:hypothetical protein